MLEVFFCNVGDGDAILLTEHLPDGTDYHVMVDTGRPCLDSAEGSLRKEAVYYLIRRNVRRLDRMILTHLHIDHTGGASRIVRTVPTGGLYALYLPPAGAGLIMPSFRSTVKTVNNLVQQLNLFRELIGTAEETGCEAFRVRAGTEQLTKRLSVTAYLPRKEIRERQREVFDSLYLGKDTEPDTCYRAAKERNVSSLMLRFEYAGRSILLTGDRYASDWENEEIPQSDIVKLPHHGDPKSMTEPLIRKLAPQYAVISCQNDPGGNKDRPNAEIVSMLQRNVPHILCTENRSLPTLDASTHNGILFRIGTNGSICCSME